MFTMLHQTVSSLLVLIAVGCASALNSAPKNTPFTIQGREVEQTLTLSNSFGDYGDWGPVEVCANGSYAFAAEINFQPPDNLDETAINAVRLYCKTLELVDTGYISSTTGDKGNWYGMQICSDSTFMTGMRVQVLEYQGIFTDDVAVQDFEFDCYYGREIVDALPGLPDFSKKYSKGNIETASFREGDWSTWAICEDGLAVCGIQTRYEDASLGDESAICDIALFCCS